MTVPVVAGCAGQPQCLRDDAERRRGAYCIAFVREACEVIGRGLAVQRHCRAGYVGAGLSARAMVLKTAASGQADAKATRMRVALSMTRAATLSTRSGQFNSLLTPDFPFVLTQSFAPEVKAVATERFQKKFRQMASSNDVAISQTEELLEGADELMSNRWILGEHHLSLMVMDTDRRRLLDRLSEARAAAADIRFLGAFTTSSHGPGRTSMPPERDVSARGAC